MQTIANTIAASANTISTNKEWRRTQHTAVITGINSMAITPAIILFFISYLLPILPSYVLLLPKRLPRCPQSQDKQYL